MSIWKADAAEKRAIRAVAAASEGHKPMAIKIEVGERVALDGSGTVSTNLLTFGPDEDGIDRSDLHQPLPWHELDHGIPLVGGKAIVDFYVYEKVFGDTGDLLTNVQAHVVTINGRPILAKITGTGIPTVSGETLNAFQKPEKSRQFGSKAYYDIVDWRKKVR